MISIIIITTNENQLPETLDALQLIEYPVDHETIVVMKNEPTSRKLSNYHIRLFHYISHKQKKITIPEQRNLGIKESKGDIIVFIDANCIPSKEWLQELLRPIYQEQEYIVSGNTFSSSSINFRKKQKKQTSQYLSEAPTINLAVKKEVFSKIGMFDDSFEYGSDVDFTWRAVQAGYSIKFAPRAMITHDWGNYSEEFKRAFRYGKARVQLYRKHKHLIIKLFSKDFVTLLYPVLAIILPLAIIFPPILIVFIILLIKNKNNNPFFTVIYNLIYGSGVIFKLLLDLFKKHEYN